MIDSIKKYEKTSIATSILLVIFSAFLIFRPQASLNFIVIVIGVFMALVGIIHMVSYFTSNKEFRAMSTELIEGTVYAVVGIFLIFKPGVLSEFLGVLVGIWQIIQFIIKFQFAFNLKSISSPSWSFLLINSILHLLFGLLLIVNPFGTLVTITTIAGVILLITEIINIIESIMLLIKN